MKDWNNFFGTKLNTVLLLILIILVAFMYKKMFFQSPINTVYHNTSYEISGNKDDLISFSVKPGQKVSGLLAYQGAVKNNYFFEANVRINILDQDKNPLQADHATATTDWMTSGPVSFAGKINITSLPKGPAYFEIHNDNPSDLPQNDKSILIPIVIE